MSEETIDELVQKLAQKYRRMRDEAVDLMVKRALVERRPHVYVWTQRGANPIQFVISFEFPENIDDVEGTIERIDVGAVPG